MSKTLYIIAGCNGAGKTTASFSILPTLLKCKEFINADEIARGLSPFKPESVAIEAGRIMLNRINELIILNKTFCIETTLRGKGYLKLIQKAKKLGYSIVLIFFWLRNLKLAIQPVKKRVLEGGHHIPTNIIKRRYKNGLHNLINFYIDIVDNYFVYDNSFQNAILIADGGFKQQTISDFEKWNKIKNIANA